MSDKQLIELARRAIACAGWRWMPGMHHREDYEWALCCRVLDGRAVAWYVDGEVAAEEEGDPPPLPDLSDPATLGCLLALVRDAWGDAFSNYCWTPDALAVTVTVPGRGIVQFAGEPAAALVAALEAAPG